MLQKKNNKTVYFGNKSLSFLAEKIWEPIPDYLKNENSLIAFKQNVKNWTTDKCPCRLCKRYKERVGFI